MPDECAKALLPTTALLACTGMAHTSRTSLLVRMISVVSTPQVTARHLGRDRVEMGHAREILRDMKHDGLGGARARQRANGQRVGEGKSAAKPDEVVAIGDHRLCPSNRV